MNNPCPSTFTYVGLVLQADQNASSQTENKEATPGTETGSSGKGAHTTGSTAAGNSPELQVQHNQTIDGISALAVIVIASFAIDRIVTALMFLLSFSKYWTRFFPVPELIPEKEEKQKEPKLVVTTEDQPKTAPASTRTQRLQAERRQKLAYYTLAFILGGVVLGAIGKVTIFQAVGFKQAPFYLDCVMTGLILVAGADRIAGLLKLPGAAASEKPSPRPIEITGKLVLEGDSAKVTAATEAGNKP